MSSAEAQLASQKGNALEPVESQEMFAQKFDLSQPDKALTDYQRLMLKHTKQQFQSASDSSRRRSSSDSARMSSLSTESSVDSTAS